MRRSELLALGVPEASIREIQRTHGEEVQKAQRTAFEPSLRENDRTREAIAAMLPMLKTPRSLAIVLDEVSYLYYAERRPKPSVAPVGASEQSTPEEIPLKALAEQENTPAVAE